MATDTTSIMGTGPYSNLLTGTGYLGLPNYTGDEYDWYNGEFPWMTDPYTSSIQSDDDAKGVMGNLGWKQVGNKILDAAGSVLATLTGNQTLKDVIAGLYTNYQVNINKGDQEYLKNTAIKNLTDFAAQLGSMQQPDLLKYVQDVAKAVELGKLSPAQAQAAIQQQSEAKNIKVPQNILDAQQDTLSGLQQRAQEGYTVTDRAAIQKALDQVMTRAQGEQAAIQDDLRARGQYGAGSELVGRQLATQAAANTAAQNALDVEAQSRAQALNALGQAGNQANQMANQSFSQQQAIASAQDQINQFNAQMQNSVNLANQNAINQTNQYNQNNAYNVQNKNLDQANLLQQNQLKAAQQQYDNQLNALKQQQQALTSAAGNAAGMWKAPYEAQKAAQAAQNQQLAGLLGQNTASGGSSVGNAARDVNNIINTGKNLWDAGKSVWDFFSDEDVKNDKHAMSDDEIMSILDGLNPNSFKYNDKARSMGAPAGKVIGVMAQDLERTPAKGIVIQDRGVKKIQGDEAISLALAALASLNNRMKKLEE